MSFYYGPLNKSLYTQQFELFTKCLLACPRAVSFCYDNTQAEKKQLYGVIEKSDIKVNVSKLLTKTDFTDVSLSEADSQAYFRNYTKNTGYNVTEYNATAQYDGQKTCPTFLGAEYSAIKDYTGSAYYGINNCMYQNGTNYIEVNGKIEGNTAALDLINIMFISSGLNRIMPDSDQAEHQSFRGEHSTSEAEIQSRIDSMKSSDGFVTTPAYTSTSSDKDVAKNFSGSVLIKYEGLFGKSIECISHFPHEKEYLLQPSKIQWLEHTEKNKNKYGEDITVHEFKARVVRPLIEGENDPDFSDIEAFKKLAEWAQKNKIDMGFITDYNKNVYLKDCLFGECFRDDTLPLEDVVACVVEKSLTFLFDKLIDSAIYLSEAVEREFNVEVPSDDILNLEDTVADAVEKTLTFLFDNLIENAACFSETVDSEFNTEMLSRSEILMPLYNEPSFLIL